MAWSWLRRRADRPSVPTPTTPQPQPMAAARSRDDWQELPAVQRTLGPLRPVAPLDVFTSGLAAHQNPSFLAPLGHRVDPHGPGGLVTGLTSVPPEDHTYADSSPLAVPTPRKPQPAVQRRTITWSTTTAAPQAESLGAGPGDTAPSEENPAPEPAHLDTGDIEVGDGIRPAPPAGPSTAAPPPPPMYAAATEPNAAHPDAAPMPDPGSSTADAEVVTPEPAPAIGSEGEVAPLLGAPAIAATAATTEAKPDPVPAGPTGAAAPLTVSRLAQGTVSAPPLAGRPVAGGQSSAPDGGQPGAQPPTISSAATPVPDLQRQLAVVPEQRPRSGVLPPPFTVDLPVVAQIAAEPPPAAGTPGAALPLTGLSSDTLPTGAISAVDRSPEPTPAPGLPTAPTSSPQDPSAAGLSIADLRTASASSPDPVSADPDSPAGQPEPEAFGAEPADPTAPLSGFAARIASLTQPPEDAPPPAAAPGLPPSPVQRLVGPAAPSHNSPGLAEPPGGRAGTPRAVSAQSAKPLLAPTEGGLTPLVQRTADQPADPSADPAAVPPQLPVAPSGTHEAGSQSPDLSPDAAFPGGASTPGDGRDLTAPSGGLISAPDTPLPVVARLTSTEQPPATPQSTPSLSTATAALVSHRPPLAIPAGLSSAVSPPPAVQRVSYPGPGQPPGSRRSEAPAVAQRNVASPGTPAFGEAVENPVSVEVLRRTVTDEPPVVATLDTTGRAGRRMEPIPVQRRSVSKPPTPLPTAAAGPASGSASGMPPIIGQTRSFSAMFASTAAEQSAGEAEDHPGYTTVQLQSAAEPPPTAPAPEEPSAVPPAAASAAGAVAAASTAGAAAADLDEMVRRLFEPLSARLRAELWLDRERAGLVTDARY